MSERNIRVLSSWFLERKLIGDRIRLCTGVTLVGRQAGSATTASAIFIDSQFVSRKHAQIIVDKDDRIVLKDLDSANGTYVNGTKVQNEETSLKANDCIGIGVTDDSEPDLKHPIYKLIYSPLPKATSTDKENAGYKEQSKKKALVDENLKKEKSHELTKTASVAEKDAVNLQEVACASNVSAVNIKKEAATLSVPKPQNTSLIEADNNLPIAKPTTNVVGTMPSKNNAVSATEITTASSSSKLPRLFSGEIIVLSDDDEDDDIRPTIKPESKKATDEKDSNVEEKVQSAEENNLNNAHNTQQNTTPSDKASSSVQLPQNFANDAVPHEPILPDVKREFVRSCTKNVVDIFGGADDLILESVKALNHLVYTNLNGKSVHKTLFDGDQIELSSDSEDDDRSADQNVESFGQLIEVKENGNNVNESKPVEENKNMQNVEVRTNEKSPNLFDISLNSSNDIAEENNKTKKKAEDSIVNQAHDITTEDAAKVAEELAEFVGMDDDMMFSQILINDIKSEMMAGNNEEFADEDEALRDEEEEEDDIPHIQIKPEPIDEDYPNLFAISAKQNQNNAEIENDIWIISDDEYYDEELEHKVSDWSTKLLSQKMNMSQVFDLPIDKEDDLDRDDEDKQEEEGPGLVSASEDLDDFFNEALVDDVIATLAQKTGEAKPVLKPALEPHQMSTETSSSSGKSKELVKNKEKKNEENDVCRKAATERKPSNESVGNDKGEKVTTTSKISTHRESYKSSDSKESTSNEKERKSKKELPKPVKRLHHPPSVIDAPNLPKHKGKLRGVSAEIRSPSTSTTDIRKKATLVSGQLKDERYREELKKKWFEKPVDERRRENEKKRKIKESRKERLKELADKHAAETTNNNLKRKHTPQGEAAEMKKAKVKITAMNRGALLAEDMESTKKPTYRIPKTKRPSTDATKIQKETSTNVTPSTSKQNNSTPVDAFAQEMAKVDQIISRRLSNNSNNGKSLSRSSSMDGKISAETKGPNAPARRTNKISFASMQKNFNESRKNQELLANLASNRSCLIDVKHRNADQERKKKKVRFNETPIIHYIERINGANKRVDCKDILPSPTCADRANMVRKTYAMVDKTPQIISQILGWSNEWLVNRNAQVDAASDILLPMPNQFSTFNHYKSIVIPLMKLEFISVLEREKTRIKSKTFNVNADQVTPFMDRFIILARCSSKISDTKCELVVLEWGRFTTFAYLSSKRPGVSTTTVVYEVLAKDLKLEELRDNLCKTITVRPMIDIVRVEFGAFNAIYQLEQSPLTKQIIDPMELFKLKPFGKGPNVQYCGFDILNERQKDVLINIYRRTIDPTPNIALIQGPPGTGKSCVIANLVHQLLYGNEVRMLDQKVLICAQSNAAVDAIAEKLFDMSQKKLPDNMFRLIRFGLLDRISPKVRHATLPKIIERNQIRKLKLSCSNLQLENAIDIKEYLRNEILHLEADIAHMRQSNIKGTVQEEQLLEKHRQVQLMRNIVNGVLRPEDERSLYNWHLMHANVVCTTLSSCVKLSQYVNYFDVCIIDEATQCTEPWTLMPLKFGINTLVLVGDTQQLPATVLSKKASDFGLGKSLFTRIQRCIESVSLKSAANRSNEMSGDKSSISNSNDILFSLQTQYRMHPEICKWPNSYFYKNELIDDPKTHLLKTPLKPFSVLNLTYTQDNNCLRGQIVNELEAKFVARLVQTLDGYIPMKYNSYGVITPYAQHRGALEKAMSAAGFPNVMVNTIDSYQGMERDVIIISNARTTGIGFLANYQRLNVALTRPKKCLILCGNLKNLESVPAWRSLLTSARERKLYHELSADCMDDMHRNVIPKIKIKATTAATTTTKEHVANVPTTNQSKQ